VTCYSTRVRHCDWTRTLACHIYKTSSFSNLSGCSMSNALQKN